jgi:hypothetical protein
MRRTASAALVLMTAGAFAATVPACAGSPPPALRGPAQAVVRAAAARTEAAGSARVDVTMAIDTAGTGMAGTGVVDLRQDTASLTFGRTGSAARLDDRFSVVAAGATDYVEATEGAPMPGTTGAAPWLAGSPRLLVGAARARMTPLDTLLVRPDAATDLDFLRGAVDVLPYGGQEIRGANTYRYSVDIDLPVAIAASPPADRPALEAAYQAIGSVLWPVDVWIDTSGRVRHLEMSSDPEAHTTTTKGNVIIFKDMGNALPFTDLDFYDFGTPANIAVPNSAHVVEAQ